MALSGISMLLCVALLQATFQSSAQQMVVEPSGALKGYVYCGDTGSPARFAGVQVRLVSSLGSQLAAQSHQTRNAASAQTDLNGRFFLDGLVPGDYLVVVSLPGYLDPLAQFTWDELVVEPTNPVQRVKDRLISSVLVVTVGDSQVSQVSIRLERGAEISGRISYDDESPVIGVQVNILRNSEKEHQWRELYNGSGSLRFPRTDDRGQFRITGLSAGRYLLCVRLPPEATIQGGLLGGQSSWHGKSSSVSDLRIYFGNTIRQDHAKSIALTTGEMRTDIDIQIPISKFHEVNGTVSNEGNSQPVHDALILVNFADSGANVFRVHVDDGLFEIPFVPVGDYSLSVSASPWEDKLHRTHAYKSIQMPLHVEADTDGFDVRLPEISAPDKSPLR